MSDNVRVFKSTDTNAPVLSGSAGALITVLDACLVNGYNSATVLIVRSGTTATVTQAVHGRLVGDCVLISGANETAYNGEFYIVAIPDANSFTYTVAGSPATPATGVITAKKCPLTWTKPYTGTNLAAYLQGTGGNTRYFRVDDTGTTSARALGYEAMTAISTGTGDFPTAAQTSGGGFIPKSAVADATARPWWLFGNSKLFFFVADTNNAATLNLGICFGNFPSYKVADTYNEICILCTSANTTSLAAIDSTIATIANHFITRTYAQTGTSITAGKHTDAAKVSSLNATMGSVGLPYPNGPDGALYLAPLWITETTAGHVRGTLPGLWTPLHNKPLAHLDTFAGTGTIATKTFLVINLLATGQLFIETSNTWYS